MTHMLKKPYNDGDCSFAPDLFITRELQRKRRRRLPLLPFQTPASVRRRSKVKKLIIVSSFEGHHCLKSREIINPRMSVGGA